MNKGSSESFQKTTDSFESPKFIKHTISEIQQEKQLKLFEFLSNRKDDYRCDLAYKQGGFTCGDQNQIDKLRSVGKQMIKIIGRKILSGELNLTKISFPIRACANKTALQNSVQSCVIFPHFVNRAAYCKDPLQRFKLCTVALLSSTAYIDLFLKPLNPIIGETLQGSMKDGTKIYCQQISHHPPISYFLIYGPKNCYQFSGYYDFDISPGFNSLSMKNKGHRKFLFDDGTQIVATYATGVFSSTFIGTSRIQETQLIQIVDKKNGYKVKIQFDKVKKRPSDYFQSVIMKDEKPVQQIFGTYCGYIQINKKRYWDLRDFEALDIDYKNISEPKLKSSFEFRPDLILLKQEKMQQAQIAKQKLQQIQRTDEKHRKKYRGILRQQQSHHHHHHHQQNL